MTKKAETKEQEPMLPLSKDAASATPSKAKKERPAKQRELVVKVHQPPPVPPPPRSMLEVIMSAVRDPACDVEKMKALLDMQERVEARDAQKQFTQAFNALQEELPVITKDGIIDHGDTPSRSGKARMKARFATYPNIMKVCSPLLKKHGFTLSNVIEPSADGARINVVGYLEHIAGHQRISRFPLGIDTSGSKNNLQGWGSSQQYGMRYNAIALLNIVSEAPQDQDNDGHVAKGAEPEKVSTTISPAEAAELRLAIGDAELPEAKFCEKYGIDDVEHLPSQMLREAKKSIAEFKQRRAAEAKKPYG